MTFTILQMKNETIPMAKKLKQKKKKTDFAAGFVLFVNYTASYKRVALEIMLL